MDDRESSGLPERPAGSFEADRHRPRGEKYLTFYLGGEEYGLEMASVQALLGADEVTPIRDTASFIRGTVTREGRSIPVVDLRESLDLPIYAQTQESCVVVVKADGCFTGIIADRVSEVLDIPREGTDGASSSVLRSGGVVRGIGRMAGRERRLLDVNRIVQGAQGGRSL